MANVFKNYTGEATTGGATIYTIPASTTGILMGLNLANKTGSQVTASVQLGSTYIVKDAPIPSGAALGVLDGHNDCLQWGCASGAALNMGILGI